MMRCCWIYVAICAIFSASVCHCGNSNRLAVTVDTDNAGFFLKPLYDQPGKDAFSLDTEEEHLVVTHPFQGGASVRAKYGPFSASQPLSPDLLQASVSNQTDASSNMILRDLDLSAHLVTRTVTTERPLLQVLFHASHLTPHQDESHSDTLFCMQMHVTREGRELTSVCVLNSRDNVCVTELTLPPEWWLPGTTQSADVHYSAHSVDEKTQCSSAPPSDDMQTADQIVWRRSFVSTVTLTHGQLTYQELKEDQHILIYIPQKSFYPGSKFKVPVKLQAESDLKIFVTKVRARHGLHVVGVEPNNPDEWRVRLDLNHKQHGAMVTAAVKHPNSYSKMDRVQDIFSWIFEVDEQASGEDRGRLTLILEYEMMSGGLGETYGSVENKVVARVEIQRDNTYTIVPVIKSTELVNSAVLTGKIQNLPMRVYSISQAGKIGDITSQTTCHSGDEDVLKVVQSCNLVYVDGSETKGSPSVSVIAKYGRHTKFLFFRVWVPELPLVIDLSDSKLSQIKGWKTPKHQRTSPAPPSSSPGKGSSPSSSRFTRGVDYGILPQPEQLLREDGMRQEDFSVTCSLRFQQSLVDIYARFSVPDGVRSQFFVHRKALLRVTDLVQDRLRIADTSIASLEGRVIEGLQSGRTEIQVLNQQGRVIGATEVKVANDKVEIERLEVNVVSGVSLELRPQPDLPGTLTARVHTQSQLLEKYQEAILDVSVKFDDGTRMALHSVPASDYYLDSDTLNNHIVGFGPMLSKDTPRVIALGPGKGELMKLSLELGDACQRKKSRPLAVSYVYIDVDFEESGTPDLQNDASHLSYGGPSDMYRSQNVQSGKGVLHVSVEGAGGKPGKAPREHMPMHEEEVLETPYKEAQQQPIVEAQSMTALEIGMYNLLGVFCLAIVVLMVNCVIFVVRYRHKRQPLKGREHVSQAPDWVWIGRATLERNAISTTCQQALMPDADFNGNHSLQLPVSQRSSAASRQSQRNSTVSTYKGSECSIRITANPLMDENANPQQEEETQPLAPSSLDAGPSTLPPIHHYTLPPPRAGGIGFHSSTRASTCSSVPDDSLRRRKLAELEEAVASGSELEFDYESLGMTYEQLMDYFDNLKESTA